MSEIENGGKLLTLGHLGMIVGPLKEHVEGRCEEVSGALEESIGDISGELSRITRTRGFSHETISYGSGCYEQEYGIPTATDAKFHAGDPPNVFECTPPNMKIVPGMGNDAFAVLKEWLDEVKRGYPIPFGLQSATERILYLFPESEIGGKTVVFRPFYDRRNETWVRATLNYFEPDYEEDFNDYANFVFRFMPDSVNVFSLIRSPFALSWDIENGDVNDSSAGISWQCRPGDFHAVFPQEVMNLFANAREFVFFNEAAYPGMQSKGSKVRVSVVNQVVYDATNRMTLNCSPLVDLNGEVWILQITLPVPYLMSTPQGNLEGHWMQIGTIK